MQSTIDLTGDVLQISGNNAVTANGASPSISWFGDFLDVFSRD